MKLKVSLILIVLILLFSCIFILLCQDNEKSSSGNVGIKRIESEIRFSFPANSKVAHFFQPDVLVDPLWVAKIVVPLSSYDNIVQSLRTKSTDNTVYRSTLASSKSWWKPINTVLTKQYLADSNTLVKIIVSKEEGEIALYIECITF